MSLPDVLMTVPMLPAATEALNSCFVLHRLWEQPDPAAFLERIGGRIRGITTSGQFGQIDGGLLDHLPSLEIIASFGVGYDNVDVEAAHARGIVVSNTPGVLDEEVADLTIGLLLATLRQIPQADRFLREGRWHRERFPLSPTLRGRSIGILGLGCIGKAVARRLQGFDVSVAYHGRARQPAVPYRYHQTLVGLASASDTLIVTVPGGADTKHLVSGEILAALGRNGVLVNVSRGSVVDQQALIDALASEGILVAGLDVFDDEPRVPQALLDIPNLVLLPHIGSASTHTRNAMGCMLVDNLKAWFNVGRPLSPVPGLGRGGDFTR